MPAEHRPLYTFGKLLFSFIFRIIFRTTITGRDRVPSGGGLMVLCNHISYADPPMVGVAVPRPVDFLAMVELFRNPFLARIVRAAGAFPVDRSRVDGGAAREVIRRLRAGRCVIIFPEAGIRQGEQSVLGGNPVFKPGAGAMALLGHVPVLPMILRGTRKPYDWRNWFRRETMCVTLGYPFSLWNPKDMPYEEQRNRARDTLREQLLKTVELN